MRSSYAGWVSPILVLLDNTRADVIRDLQAKKVRLADVTLSKEERQLAQLVVGWGSNEHLPRLLHFPWPDIICGLPERAVRRVAPNFPGWNRLVEEYRDHAPMNFKDFTMMRLGKDRNSVSRFLSAVLASTTEETEPAANLLDRVIDEALAFAF